MQLTEINSFFSLHELYRWIMTELHKINFFKNKHLDFCETLKTY